MYRPASALDHTFQALADPTRRALIDQLRGGYARVTDLASHHPMSLNAVSKHIKVLEAAGLVPLSRAWIVESSRAISRYLVIHCVILTTRFP